jgi:adenosylhomocysteine nucleosidase
MTLTVITGLAAEARIAVSRDAGMIVGGGRADWLAHEIESAVKRGARRFLSFGVAGGLSPELRPGDLVVAHSVRVLDESLPCDWSWRRAMNRRLLGAWTRDISPEGRTLRGAEERLAKAGVFRFVRGTGWRPIFCSGEGAVAADIAGVDAPVVEVEQKSALFKESGAVAVDMESAVVARAALRHGTPFAVLRVVADPAHRPLPASALVATGADGEVDIPATLGALIRNPRDLSVLFRLAFDARAAFAALSRVRALLGPDFGSAELGEPVAVGWREALEADGWVTAAARQRLAKETSEALVSLSPAAAKAG